jgi:hypothetical protein
MSDRQNQRRLDDIAMKYLAAIEASDFDAIEAMWIQAADDSDMDAMLHGLNSELAAETDASENATIDAAVLDNIQKHMPSAEVIR